MSPCTPTTPFPTNFLATPVHISTLKRNEDATWATWQVESPARRPVWCLCTANLHLVVTQFSFSFPSPSLISVPGPCAISCTHSQAADAAGMASFCSSSAAFPHEQLPFHLHRSLLDHPYQLPYHRQAQNPPTTGEDLGYVTTPCMSQQSFSPKTFLWAESVNSDQTFKAQRGKT